MHHVRVGPEISSGALRWRVIIILVCFMIFHVFSHLEQFYLPVKNDPCHGQALQPTPFLFILS